MKPHKSLIVIAVLAASTSSLFVRLADMPPLVISFYRLLTAVAVLGMPFLFSKQMRSELTQISRKDWLLTFFSGVMLALHFATWIASLSQTSVAAATVLVSCSPIFIAILSVAVYKKKPGKTLIICLIFAILGTIMIALSGSDGGFGNLSGNMLALAGAFFVAVYLMIGAVVRERLSTNTYAFVTYGFSTITLLLCSLIFSQPLTGYGAKDYLLAAGMGIVCSVGGHTLYNLLLKTHGAVLISLSTLCEPIAASLMSVFILREIPSLLTVAGGVIIIASLMYYLTKNRNSEA